MITRIRQPLTGTLSCMRAGASCPPRHRVDVTTDGAADVRAGTDAHTMSMTMSQQAITDYPVCDLPGALAAAASAQLMDARRPMMRRPRFCARCARSTVPYAGGETAACVPSSTRIRWRSAGRADPDEQIIRDPEKGCSRGSRAASTPSTRHPGMILYTNDLPFLLRGGRLLGLPPRLPSLKPRARPSPCVSWIKTWRRPSGSPCL